LWHSSWVAALAAQADTAVEELQRLRELSADLQEQVDSLQASRQLLHEKVHHLRQDTILLRSQLQVSRAGQCRPRLRTRRPALGASERALSGCRRPLAQVQASEASTEERVQQLELALAASQAGSLRERVEELGAELAQVQQLCAELRQQVAGLQVGPLTRRGSAALRALCAWRRRSADLPPARAAEGPPAAPPCCRPTTPSWSTGCRRVMPRTRTSWRSW
jgi:chromosome segregation ATPase